MTNTARAARITCPDCGDTLEPGRVNHSRLPTGGPIIVEQVPAMVCPQCGYTAIPAATWGELDRLMAERPVPVRYVSVPVYDLSEFPGAEVQIPSRRAEQPDQQIEQPHRIP